MNLNKIFEQMSFVQKSAIRQHVGYFFGSESPVYGRPLRIRLRVVKDDFSKEGGRYLWQCGVGVACSSGRVMMSDWGNKISIYVILAAQHYLEGVGDQKTSRVDVTHKSYIHSRDLTHEEIAILK